MRLDARRQAYLRVMGITLWSERAAAADPIDAAGAAPPSGAGSPSDPPDHQHQDPPESVVGNSSPDRRPAQQGSVATLNWDALQTMVSTCQGCELHQTRTQTVFGVGDRQARLMVIGEAPGAEEDRKGEPFVGRAGQLLNAMLAAIGFEREQVFIANVVKCRPPGNRDPHVDEADACRPYLDRQINLISPHLILAVGRVSAHRLLDTDLAVGKLRGRVHSVGKNAIPLIVTYHPAYLLRRPPEKAKAWQDLQAAWQMLNAG